MTADTTTVGNTQDASPSLTDAHVPKTNWGWFLLRGLLAITLGIVAILFPASAIFAFTMLFAAFAFVDGLASIISGVRGSRDKKERWWALILRGLVGVVVGAIFVMFPLLTTVAYALVSLAVVAAWSIITGVLEIWAAIRLRKEIKGEWLLAISGLLSVLLGLAIPVIMAINPVATILSVGWVIGAYALAAGIVLIVQAIRLRTKRAKA